MTKNLIAQVKNIMVVHKKKIGSGLVLVALLGTLSAGAHAMFQVRGVVTNVGSDSITVANFFRTQTVELAGSTVNVSDIKPGDRVKIQKSLQGNVLYARTYSSKDDEHGQERKHR